MGHWLHAQRVVLAGWVGLAGLAELIEWIGLVLFDLLLALFSWLFIATVTSMDECVNDGGGPP